MKHTRGTMQGFSLLEVMIAMAILSIGLLGLAGLQARAHVAETESYSRGQALVLAREMADRILANLVEADEGKKGATSVYNAGREFGVGEGVVVCPGVAPNEVVGCSDLTAWQQSLQGAAVQSAGNAVGGIRGAKGCVVRQTVVVGASTFQQYVVSVAWLGQGNFGTPPADRTCGSAAIPNNRRVVSLVVPIADLGGT